MTIKYLIDRLEQLREDLLTDTPDELTTYAKEQAAIHIESAIQRIKDNEK